MIRIQSRKNEYIKELSGLVRSSEKRHAQGLFVVEGARLCRDAARSGLKLEAVLVTPQAADKYAVYVKEITAKAKESIEIADSIAPLLSDTRSPQGVFCVVHLPSLEERGIDRLLGVGRYLAVENMQDPANLGAVCRTAEALGISGVILLGTCCDFYGPKALRAGMGAAFRLPVYMASSFQQAVPVFRDKQMRTFAAVPDEKAVPVTQCDFTDRCVMLVGNEGNGLLPETIATCDQTVTIPMLGRAESLNAAASASILMWEMMREKGD